MPDREAALLLAVKAGLATTHASHDLTGRVEIGMYELPLTHDLFVAVHPLPNSSSEGDSVREWAFNAGFQVTGWAPATTSPEARVMAAMLLRGDLLDALHGLFIRDDDPAILGLVWDVRIESFVLDSDVWGPATGSWGQVIVEVGYTLLADQGRI